MLPDTDIERPAEEDPPLPPPPLAGVCALNVTEVIDVLEADAHPISSASARSGVIVAPAPREPTLSADAGARWCPCNAVDDRSEDFAEPPSPTTPLSLPLPSSFPSPTLGDDSEDAIGSGVRVAAVSLSASGN
jgi:hypothetical protein